MSTNTPASRWRLDPDQVRAVQISSLRTLAAWLEARSLPQIPFEVDAGSAKSNLGNEYRFNNERAREVIEAYAAALGTQVHEVEVSEYDGYPALVVETKMPLETTFDIQQHLFFEIYYVIEREDEDR